MIVNKWQKKAAKYKTKYLSLKKQLGGVFESEFKFESEFMTSKILPESDNYLSQPLFNYWISSSHNTYLPHDQNIDKVSVCYYRLQYIVYAGGCVEIDTYGIKDGKVIISHMNNGYINLDDILDIIMEALISKIKRKIISGPFILNFDNSSPLNSLKTKEQQNIFWKTIDEKLLKGSKLQEYRTLLNNNTAIPVLEIEDNFDLSLIPIKDMSNKIIFRWGLNKNCNSEKVGHELCPLLDVTTKFNKNKKQWIHLDKGKMGFTENYVYSPNMSESKSSPFFNKLTKINLYSIVN